MNAISRDIEKERLLDDCIKCRCHNAKDDLVKILDICIEENMNIYEIESILKDNTTTIGEYRGIMLEVFSRKGHAAGLELTERLYSDMMSLSVTLIR